MSLLARRIAGVQSMSALDTVRFAARIDCSELGHRYVESVAATDSGRFIDKFPLNFLYVGLIHLALPQARIVHLTRDPLDTCVAIYKQKFENAHPYSYDLDDLDPSGGGDRRCGYAMRSVLGAHAGDNMIKPGRSTDRSAAVLPS